MTEERYSVVPSNAGLVMVDLGASFVFVRRTFGERSAIIVGGPRQGVGRSPTPKRENTQKLGNPPKKAPTRMPCSADVTDSWGNSSFNKWVLLGGIFAGFVCLSSQKLR